MRWTWVLLVASCGGGEISDAGSDASLDAVSDRHDADAVSPDVAPLPPPCDAMDASDASYCADDAGVTVQATWSFADDGQSLTINRCDRVVWTNTDNGTPHSVVGLGACYFDTGTNFGGAFAPVRFTTSGTFTYFCSVHATQMKGSVTVQ